MNTRALTCIGVALLSVLTAGALASCGSDGSSGDEGSEGEPLVIGFAAGLTGIGAVSDVPARAGMEYAVSELNENGGVDGHEVEFIVKDMKSDPKLSGVVAQELLDDGADVLLGAPFSDQNVGTIRAGGKAGVPTVLVASTDPANVLLGGRPAYFTAFGDNQQAAAAAEYARKQGYETALTVSSPDTSYTGTTPKWFAETFEELGGEVVGDVQFSIGQQDFSSVATKIAALKPQPDVIYTLMFVPDTPIFLKALRSAGVDTPVIGADGFDSRELIKAAGEAAEGTTFTSHGFASPGSKLAEVIDGIMQREGEEPESIPFAGLGYDSIQIIAAAVEQAGSVEPEKIDEALADLDTVEGATGEITLKGTNGVPTKPVTLIEVKDGKFAFADQFTPKYVPTP